MGARPCEHCGAEFIPLFRHSRFCSPACNTKHCSSVQSTKRLTGVIRHCVVCCGKFEPPNRSTRTCGEACEEMRGTVTRVGAYCSICGEKFLPRNKTYSACSKACMVVVARRAHARELTCDQCGTTFSAVGKGRCKRCQSCRAKGRPRKKSKTPCDWCGEMFTHVNADARFCSHKCSSLGINSEGIGNSVDVGVYRQKLIDYVLSCDYAPTLEEVCYESGISSTWVSRKLKWTVDDLFAAAGRSNEHIFASKFEEQVYRALLGVGLKSDDITRQAKFDGLRGKSGRWPLRYDFYIPGLNLLVEADGQQHTAGTIYHSETLARNDARKNEYAKTNGISLVRIPYKWHYKKVYECVCQRVAPLYRKVHSKAL